MPTQANAEYGPQHQHDVTGQPQIIEPSLERLMGNETALPTQEQEVSYGTLAAASPEQILRKKAPKISQHTIQAGEGLWTIAKKYNPLAPVTEIAQLVQKIVELNKLGSAKALIAPGQVLKVPSTINTDNKKQSSKKTSPKIAPKIDDKLRALEQRMMGQQPDRTRVFQQPIFKEKKGKKENISPIVKPQTQRKSQGKKVKSGHTALANLMKKSVLTPQEFAVARSLIEQEKDTKKKGDLYLKLQYKVPYYNQRDSKHGASIADAMCNMSSMAMGLALLGVPNPKPDMQYDDALEQIRQDHYNRYPRTSTGQFKVASHLGCTYGGLNNESFGHTNLHKPNSHDYNWYKKHVIPQLREGTAITLSIGDGKNGHIVHLIDVKPNGLIVHDPYAKADFSKNNYLNVMHTNANSRDISSKNAEKGKQVLWSFESIKKSSPVGIQWIRRVTKNKK